MKKGLKNIRKDGRFGMRESDMKAIQRVADKSNNVIGISRVNKAALSLLEEGDCLTKHFVIKNKTAESGFVAGFIPENPEYADVNESEYLDYQIQLKNALRDDQGLSFIPCELSHNRILELQSLFGESIKLQFSADENECAISFEKQGKTISAIAKKNTDNEKYTISDMNGNIIRVLGKQITNQQNEKIIKPITADYDLLVICPAQKDLDLGGKDKTPFATTGQLRYIQAIIKASALPFYLGPKEDERMGNVSRRDREMINELNSEIIKSGGIKAFHHNEEFHNPFADEINQHLPCVIFLPKQMQSNTGLSMFSADPDQSSMIMVETTQELHEVMEMVNQKYHWPRHAMLEMSIAEETSFDMTPATA